MNKPRFFSRYSMVILCTIFFMVPFALRGARYALQEMQNNVADWLPARFEETKELKWFGKHFIGEQFVVVTWPGCTAESEDFKLLVRKLRSEVKPQKRSAEPGAAGAPTAAPLDPAIAAIESADGEESTDESSVAAGTDTTADNSPPLTKAELEKLDARQVGDLYGLHVTEEYYHNWGGRGEKWLQGYGDSWYFITPEGEIVEWDSSSDVPNYLKRSWQRNVMGNVSAAGKVVARVGELPTPGKPNVFHENPRLLNARYFSSVTTGPEVLKTLSAPNGAMWPLNAELSDEEKAEVARRDAMKELNGTLFGPDGEQTCVILTLSKPGKIDLSRVIGRRMLGKPWGRVYQLACGECGVVEEDLKLGGPPVDNVAIDEEGTITLARLVGFSVGLGVILAYLSFRSVRITMIVFFVGGVSAVTSLAIVFYGGSTMDAVLMSMPSLVYVLGLSGAVHIINYYRDACIEHGEEGAAEIALGHGWWPCTLAAFTTALGLLSLNSSELIPIQKFGTYSACGVLATLILLFTYLPAALTRWAPKYSKQKDQRKSGMTSFVDKFWDRVGKFVVRRNGFVSIACVLVLGTVGWQITNISTSIQLLELFDADAKIIRDYHWLEDKLGKLVPMELVVRVDNSRMLSPAEERTNRSGPAPANEKFQLSFLERMELAARVQQVVEEEFGEVGRSREEATVGRGMSAATFAPRIPPPGGSFLSTEATFRRTLAGKLEDRRSDILASDYLRIDEQEEHLGSELWRVSLRVGAFNGIDYGKFVHELKDAVEPVIFAYSDRDKILRKIDQNRHGEGFHKAKVLFIGYDPNPLDTEKTSAAPKDTAPKDTAGTDGPDAPSPAQPEHQIDQDRIYAETIQRSLMSAGLVGPYSPKWYGPNHEKFAPENREKWKNYLEAVDCVVLVGDVPNFDETFWKSSKNAVVLDVRDTHRFIQGGDNPSLTAAKQGMPIQVIYTGVVPVVYKAQRELLTSLVHSIGWAFVMISTVMMLLLRSGKIGPTNLINFRGGLISMAPNVFPVVLVFGTMGYFRVSVDIGSMMTASVAMGIAVDDTIHFLNWFRSGIAQGLSRNAAIGLAYRRVATAMTQTTLIGGLGLSVFAYSTFTPTQRFGVLMLAMLATALIGDLVFLPAILAGPLGKYFCPKKIRDNEPVDSLTNEVVGELASGELASGEIAVEENGAGGVATEEDVGKPTGEQRRSAIPNSSTPHSTTVDLHGNKVRRDPSH